MNSSKMKIGQIREIIRRAAWVRQDLTGGTSEEFRRQQVGPRLAEKVAELRALAVPARFVRDEEQRVQEIGYCEKVIARWEAAQTTQPTPATHKHVFLGGFRCVTCDTPFTAH